MKPINALTNDNCTYNVRVYREVAGGGVGGGGTGRGGTGREGTGRGRERGRTGAGNKVERNMSNITVRWRLEKASFT